MASASAPKPFLFFSHGVNAMQWLVIALLALALGLIVKALLIWRRDGWKQKKQLIVMLIVIAAAAQLVIVVLVSRPH